MWHPKNSVESLHFAHPKTGTGQFVMRPVLGEDLALIQAGFEQTSDQSRRFRFLSSVNTLSVEALKPLVEVDQDQHVVMGIIDVSDPYGAAHPVGLVRYQRLLQNPRSAEFGIMIVDAYQAQGLDVLPFTARAA